MAPFWQRLVKKAAQNFYVTVVNTKTTSGWDAFNTNGQVTNDQLISNFETVPQLFSIIEWIAKRAVSIPVKVVNRNGKDRPNSELWNLIRSPNNFQSFKELMKLDISYYELSGNSYLYGINPEGMKIITSLWNLPVNKTVIALKYDKSLPAWMNEVAEYQTDIGGVLYHLPSEFVLHERNISMRYDDGSWIYGMSKYVPGDKINRELKAIHDAKTSLIEQRGALGFITNESEMPDLEQSKIVKEKLKSSTGYGVLGDQDKVIVTTEKLRWQQMALGVAELQLIENAKYSMAQLCEINGFDPVIFSTDGSTFANKKEAIRAAMFDVIMPIVNNRYESLSEFLSPGYNGDKIIPDWSQVEEVQADKKAMTEMISRQIECMLITPAEGREMLYPNEEGEEQPPDTFFRRTSLVPADQPETPVNPIAPDPDKPDDEGGDNGN